MKIKKSCKKCGESNLDKLLKDTSKGKLQIRNICNKCRWVQQAEWISKNPKKIQCYVKKTQQRQKIDRKDPKNSARFILMDYVRDDRKRGLENELDLEFVKEQIAKGCSYCGETEIRMSLDRIDNTRGHTRDNVVPACHRCNYVRLNMPYEAWLGIAPAMRKAREKGAFGDWMQKTRTGRKSRAGDGT